MRLDYQILLKSSPP